MIPSIILVRTKEAGNLGSAARAMKNMGMSDLRLVAPEANPNTPMARKMSMNAKDVLLGAKSFPDPAAAIGDLDLVVGTSRRFGKERDNFISLRDFAELSKTFPKNHKVGIVFGHEVTGLTNEELTLCQKIITIPVHEDYPSLNLAQAVMLVCYEIFMAESGADFSVPEPIESEAASVKDFENMIEDLHNLLGESGFLHRENPEHLMRLLRNLFNRARLTDNEVKIFRGICRQIRWWKENG